MRGVAFVLLLTTVSHAQDSQFHFDPNGNLFVQTDATTAAPQILAHPQNRIVAPDEAAAFSVVVADTRLLTYQWRFNGANISGATNDAVLLQNVNTNNEGEYRVVLTNPSGSVTSAPALLMIDSDADGLPDSWELTYFGNLNRTATADFDGDGVTNLQEFRDGTNPTNNASALFRLTVLRDGGSVAILPEQSTYTNGQIVTLTASASPNETFRAWLGDIVTRTNPVTLVMTNNKTVSARFTPMVFTWTNFAGGDWNSVTNWTPNLVPGSNDNVIISGLALQGGGTFTVTLDTPADCASVTLDTGLSRTPNLTGSGTLTVREHLLWRGGTMSGSGRTVLESGATLTLDLAHASPGNGPILNTRTLELGGNTFWTTAGNLLMNGGFITNRPGAVFHVLAAGSINRAGGAPRFDNAGTFRKTAAGITTVGTFMSFNNSGLVEIETGTLICDGGFTNSGTVNLWAGATSRMGGGGSATGTFSAPAGALVEWTGGTFTLNPGAQLNGTGLYTIQSGAANSIVNADATLTMENLDLVASDFSSSTLGGTGTVTIAAEMNWMGGVMSGSGRTVILPGAALTLSKASGLSLTGRTLENGGTALWKTGGITFNNAVFTNRPGAVFHAHSGGNLVSGGGSSRFDNAGTFRKSVNSGVTTVFTGITFNNSGTTEIQTGTLRLFGGGSGSGTFDASAATSVEWVSGTFTLNPGGKLNGAGLYWINSGTVNVDADLAVENLDLTGGTLGGANTVRVDSEMNWTGGNQGGGGRTVISPGAMLTVSNSSAISLTGRTLENGGTALWTAGTINLNNSVITNRPGALFEARNAASLFLLASPARFDNAGTFRKLSDTGTTTVGSGIPFNNSGLVDLRRGRLVAFGGYTSSSNAFLNSALGGTTAATNYGQLQVSGTVALNGSLSVELTGGFSPALDDSFTILTAGTRNGDFADFLYPSNRVTMQLSNTASSVIVRVTDLLTTIPQPMLLLPEISGSDLKLTWTVVSNVTYRVEFSPDLEPSSWTALPGDVTGVSNTASKLDPLTSSNRFYRVRVLP